MTLHEDGSGVPLAVVVVGPGARTDRPMMREEVVRTAAGAGLAIRPVLWDEAEWESVGRLVPPGDGVVAAGLAAHRAATPSALRKPVIRIVRDLRMAVDAIAEPQPIPWHVKLSVCARLVQDGMALLFAVHEKPFAADASVIAAFDEAFVRDGPFPARHATLPLRLAGLARQAELAYWATARDDDRRFGADAEVEEAADFLRLLEGHLKRALTSDAERARGERLKRLGVAALGPFAAIVFIANLIVSQPERPLATLGPITAPGAITVEYFAGEGFERKVLERTDAQIAVAPDAPVPDARLADGRWSARWNGYMLFDRSGRWHLCGRADDGQRIWLNHRLLVDDWTHDEMRTACATVKVEAGWYPLRVEYRQAGGPATLSLLRGPPRESLAAVPASALCCGPAAPKAS